MYWSYGLNFTTNNIYLTKIALVGFQYEPVSLDIKEVCFDEEQDIPNTHKKIKIKSQRDTEWCRCGKCGLMGTNVEYSIFEKRLLQLQRWSSF